MSKHNNVTTDHFKVGGSGHSGENILHEVNKQQQKQAEKAQADNASLIPNQDRETDQNQPSAATTPAPRGDKNRGGNSTPSSNSSSSDF